MIVTFYSYKGGVGRSMALANVAQWYRLQGLKVVMVDWDLEAPGLESFFTADRDEREGIQGKLGLIDLIATYRDLFPGLARPAAGGGREAFVRLLDEALPPVRHMLVPIKPAGGEADDSVGGGLWLLSAGCRGGTRFDAYAETVQRLDWDELYSRFEGEAYFEWMRRQLNDPELADVVLIDSRTGVAEMSGVCTRQLADTVVVLSAPNDQNLDGVAQMARSFTRAELQEVRGPERPIEMVMVPSRIHEAEGRPIDIFEAKFRERLDRYLPAAFKRAGTGFERLRIPYISAYSFAERLAVGDPEGVRSLQQAYANLAVHIALLAKPKTMLRRRCSEALKQAFGLPVVAIAMLDLALLDEADAFGRRLEDEGIETLPLPPGEPEAVIAALAGGQAGHAVVFAGEQNSVEGNADQLPRARALWRQARERGLCLHFWAPSGSAGVLPVGVNRLDAHADFDKVLALLSSPCRARPVPNLAPPAPVAFVGRLDLLAQLKLELLQREARDPIALVGLGGSGKSSLLRMLCQDDELVAHFDGGILWLALGPSADLLDGLCKQLLAFEPGTPQPADIDEAQRRLAELLATRRCLIVADDAWDRGQLERLPSGPQCRVILSTRTNDVALAAGARVFAIAGLSVEDATSLLSGGLSVEQGSMAEPALAELAMSVGGSPLALRLLNQNLRSRVHPGADPRAIARELQSDLASRGLNAIDSDYAGDEDSILAVLRQSAERLTPGDRACLPMLAGLKADAPIGIEQVSAITGLGAEETAGLVRRLEAVALVGTVGANQVVIHPIAQAFFRTLQHREQVATKTRIARATPASFSIYISYARGDARDAARIYDRLLATFGSAGVFFDTEAIRPGDRWMEVIEKAIRSARVMLVVIGRGWLETVNRGESHLVHEIALALQSESTVIPILMQDVSMPSADRVPAALHRLTQLNALVLSSSQFQQDMDRLIEDLSDLAPRAAQPAPVSAPAWDPESAPKAPVGTASPAPRETLQLAPRSRRAWVLGAVAAGAALLALPFVYRNASVSPPTGSLPGQSEFETAESYYFGRGVPQNAETALQWYRNSAELGYPSAQNALGRMYELGQGVPQDLTQARRWYELAAKQGHPDAKAALLRMK